MNRIMAQVQEQLISLGLLLNENGVLEAYEAVDQLWMNNLDLLLIHPQNIATGNSRVKYLIIGEAPASVENYFYNQNSRATTFLNPRYFAKENKSELINFFNANGILVFDLYPLILPTFIYDHIPMNRLDSVYIQGIEEYYRRHLNGLIDDKTQIILRYAKLQHRLEWSIFMNSIGRSRTDFISISGKGMSASQSAIEEVFGHLF